MICKEAKVPTIFKFSRFHRYVTAVIILCGASIFSPSTVYAGFFDACMQEPQATINVTQNTKVWNQTVVLPDVVLDCEIDVAEGVTLEFLNVRVSSPSGNARLVFEGGENSQLKIKYSKLNACDNDVFGFSGGVQILHSILQDPAGGSCDLMEIEPDGDLTIQGSELRALDTIEIISNRRVKIEGSKIFARSASFPGEVNIGTDYENKPISKQVLVKGSKVVSADNIVIGAQQDTTVLLNELSAKGSTVITGNPCKTTLNIPSVWCQ